MGQRSAFGPKHITKLLGQQLCPSELFHLPLWDLGMGQVAAWGLWLGHHSCVDHHPMPMLNPPLLGGWGGDRDSL